MVHQPALNHRPLVDFDALVVHIAFDHRPRLEFERLRGVYRPIDGAVHHGVRGRARAFETRVRGHHQRAGLVRQSADIAADHAVDAQAAAENHVAFDARRRADQAVDPFLRFARFVEHLVLPSALLEAHAMRRARLVRTQLVHAHLNTFHLRLRADPEGPLDPPEVLECQPKGPRAGVPRLRKAHDSTLAPFRQVDQQLQPPVEVPALPGGRRQEQEPVPIFPWQDVGLYLEAVDRQRVRGARLGRQHALESRQLFPYAGIFLLERPDLLPELLLGGALDGEAAVGRIGDSAKAVELGARLLQRAARRTQLLLNLAAVEAGKAPPGIVDPCRRSRRDAEQHRDADPAPVPRDLAVNGNARCGDAEALAQLPYWGDQIAHHALRAPPAPDRGLQPRASRTSGSCSALPGPKRP